MIGRTIQSLYKPSKFILQHRQQLNQLQSIRWKSGLPLNTCVLFVPQQEAWVVERMGKFNAILEPGLNILIPILDKIRYVQILKEIAIDIPQQSAISADNVGVNIDGVLYLRIMDPYKASYGVEDAEFAITQLAQTTMRSEIGKISLDVLFKERENLNVGIVEAINLAADAWGIQCLRYEIRDIKLPSKVQEAMQMQVEAERRKRAKILDSEGLRESDINIAEGKKQARILASIAEKTEQINAAEGRAEGLRIVCTALEHKEGLSAASLSTAHSYIGAFKELAKTNNTLILPSNVADVSSVVGSAISIYKNLNHSLQENKNSK